MNQIYYRLRIKIHRIINKLRLWDLMLSGAKIKKGVRVFGRFTWVGPASNIEISSSSTINEGVFINARDFVMVGNNVHLSPGVQLHTGSLELYEKRSHIKAPIIIEDNVWLASGVVVLQGITIGAGSVVAANSVVTANVPPYSLYGGNPAKFIKKIQLES